MSIPYDRVHIIGAGGAGMSALAKVLLARGHTVSGSDLRGGAALQGLADLGVEVFTGHNPSVAVKADLVVASSAIPDFDEELVAARAAGVETWRRPELLTALTAEIPTIGATGTHGKTTTAALMLAALQGAGEDPSFVIGGDPIGIGTNGHLGESELMILEADEAFRTFESLHLRGLVVTNVEAEHLDHFGSEESLLSSFIGVARRVEGPVVSCADDPGSARVAQEAGTRTYGMADSAHWRVSELTRTPQGMRYRLTGPDAAVAVEVSRPGAHVALNSAGALALLAEIGYDLDRLVPGIAAFKGVGRRWEHRGTVGEVILYDDYAHHPTEVRATLDAASGIARGRLWAVFQPHLYSRTERFSDEFGEALAKADVVVVTDVYGARETPVPGITGELVAEAARSRGADVHYVQHRADLAGYVAPLVMAGDLVVSMGAGDITLLPTELAMLLATQS